MLIIYKNNINKIIIKLTNILVLTYNKNEEELWNYLRIFKGSAVSYGTAAAERRIDDECGSSQENPIWGRKAGAEQNESWGRQRQRWGQGRQEEDE